MDLLDLRRHGFHSTSAGDTTDDTRFQRTVVIAEMRGSDVTPLF